MRSVFTANAAKVKSKGPGRPGTIIKCVFSPVKCSKRIIKYCLQEVQFHDIHIHAYTEADMQKKSEAIIEP